MIRRQRHYGAKPMTRQKAEHALRSLLWNCRVEMLATHTAESLHGYNVPLEKRRAMLAEVKRARGVE